MSSTTPGEEGILAQPQQRERGIPFSQLEFDEEGTADLRKRITDADVSGALWDIGIGNVVKGGVDCTLGMIRVKHGDCPPKPMLVIASSSGLADWAAGKLLQSNLATQHPDLEFWLARNFREDEEITLHRTSLITTSGSLTPLAYASNVAGQADDTQTYDNQGSASASTSAMPGDDNTGVSYYQRDTCGTDSLLSTTPSKDSEAWKDGIYRCESPKVYQGHEPNDSPEDRVYSAFRPYSHLHLIYPFLAPHTTIRTEPKLTDP